MSFTSEYRVDNLLDIGYDHSNYLNLRSTNINPNEIPRAKMPEYIILLAYKSRSNSVRNN